MTQLIVLLRGINLGARNRIAMPALREALAEQGFDDVRTYVQSGNVVLSSDATPEQVASWCEEQIAARFALDIKVVVRTRDELAEVVRRNPLGDVADDAKRYQVAFLSARPDPATVERITAFAVAPEQLVHIDRELYVWYPGGSGRSKLAARVIGPDLGVTTTARNWITVTKLLDIADEPAG